MYLILSLNQHCTQPGNQTHNTLSILHVPVASSWATHIPWCLDDPSVSVGHLRAESYVSVRVEWYLTVLDLANILLLTSMLFMVTVALFYMSWIPRPMGSTLLETLRPLAVSSLCIQDATASGLWVSKSHPLDSVSNYNVAMRNSRFHELAIIDNKLTPPPTHSLIVLHHLMSYPTDIMHSLGSGRQ